MTDASIDQSTFDREDQLRSIEHSLQACLQLPVPHQTLPLGKLVLAVSAKAASNEPPVAAQLSALMTAYIDGLAEQQQAMIVRFLQQKTSSMLRFTMATIPIDLMPAATRTVSLPHEIDALGTDTPFDVAHHASALLPRIDTLASAQRSELLVMLAAYGAQIDNKGCRAKLLQEILRRHQ